MKQGILTHSFVHLGTIGGFDLIPIDILYIEIRILPIAFIPHIIEVLERVF
jgi:hypothetical protein